MVQPGNVSLDALRVFEVVARRASFTAAGVELHTTQSAVSQRIRTLEDQLGVALFLRSRSGVRLTPEGQALLERVAYSLANIEAQIVHLQRGREQALNIVTDFAFAAYWLMPRLPAFRAAHPAARINIITQPDVVRVDDLAVDVAILYCGEERLESLLRISSQRVLPVASPTLVAQHGKPTDVAALLRMPLLGLNTPFAHEWLDWPAFCQVCAGHELAVTPALTFNTYTLLLQAAMAGQGVAIGWHELVTGLLQAGVLVGFEALECIAPGGYGAVDMRPEDGRAPKRAFLAWLAECVAAD